MQIEQKKARQANIFKVFFRIKQTFFTQKEKNVLKHNFTTKNRRYIAASPIQSVFSTTDNSSQSIGHSRNKLNSQGCGNTKETGQLHIHFTSLHSCNIALLSAQFVSKLLLRHSQFLPTAPQYLPVCLAFHIRRSIAD